MFSKSNKEYGRKPYLFDSYDDMMRTQSELQATSSGKSFKHSEMKKPYLADSYEQMERMYSPQSGGVTLYPTSELWQGRDLEDIGQYPLGEEEKPPCGCRCIILGNIVPSVWCLDEEVKEICFLVFLQNHEKVLIDSSVGTDSISIIGVDFVPFPSDCDPKSKDGWCVWAQICVKVDCSQKPANCEESRDIFLTMCSKVQTMNVYFPNIKPCTSLTITDENGYPATDTILRNGSNDYRYTGDCCGDVVWSVSVDSGSTLGGSTITQAGVLTAGATSCGSLKVTAICEVCRTSATQYVRVTDAGKWVLTSLENAVLPCSGLTLTFNCEIISGENKKSYWYQCTGVFIAGCLSDAPCYDTVSCKNFPFISTIMIGHYKWVCL